MFRKTVGLVAFIVIVVVVLVIDFATPIDGRTVVSGGSGKAVGSLQHREGCLGFGVCCPGKNVSCVGMGPSQSNKTADRCFCDEDCLRLADCCLDYRFICKPIDCRLSAEWSEWSKCDQVCGVGAQQRTRQVLVHPENGGRNCDGRVERRKCEGFSCKTASSVFDRKVVGQDHHIIAASADAAAAIVNETANVVPAIYASWRTNARYNPLEDIRQSLFLHNIKYAALLNDRKPSYCAKFRVTETRGACHRTTEGAAATGVGGSRAGGHHHSKVLTVGRTICVECQPYGILQRTMSARCIGDGLFQVETPWKAVTTSHCHGKWVRTSDHQVPCHCDPNSDTSFLFV